MAELPAGFVGRSYNSRTKVARAQGVRASAAGQRTATAKALNSSAKAGVEFLSAFPMPHCPCDMAHVHQHTATEPCCCTVTPCPSQRKGSNARHCAEEPKTLCMTNLRALKKTAQHSSHWDCW